MSDQFFAPLDIIGDVPWATHLKQLAVLRLDQIPPAFSGNKFFKLKFIIEYVLAHGITQLISFGGAYSNHIHALALAGRYYGLSTIGIIRGESSSIHNPTLSDAQNAGMKLRFVSRQEYRMRNDVSYLASLSEQYPNSFVIPEGGSTLPAVQSCMEIVKHIHHHLNENYDVVVLACGTAATMAGIVAAVPSDKRVIGVSVLKNATDLDSKLAAYLGALGVTTNRQWHIEHNYHCGGYAKIHHDLIDCMQHFERATNIELEPIYTGKMVYALSKMVGSGVISPNSRVVAIHTGGLQGLRGMKSKMAALRC